MPKCTVCGNNSVKDKCWIHKPRTPLKRTSIKPKKKTKQEKEDKQEALYKMWMLFAEIWQERPHVSEISGEPLGEEPFTYMFDHLLEKSTHKKLKYNKDNIVLLTAQEHWLKTSGFPLPKHKELIEQAKQKFL